MFHPHGRDEILPYGQTRAALVSLAVVMWTAYLGLYVATLFGVDSIREARLAALAGAMLTMTALATWIVAHVEQLRDIVMTQRRQLQASAAKLASADRPEQTKTPEGYWEAFADITEGLLKSHPDDQNAN